MLGALGVVFGDIGTSPLYALQTVFSIDHSAVQATPARRVRRHLAGLLVDHADRVGQVRVVHPARRQRRRGRLMALAALVRAAGRRRGTAARRW